MNILAQGTLWIGLITIIISSLIYLRLSYNRSGKLLNYARYSFLTFASFTTIASAFLMYFFLSHDFRFEYVAQYSSSDLPLHYLISSFWAGQEGSFLLWVLIGAWLGVYLMYKMKDTEPQVMVLYNLNLVFLSVLLIKQSPFRLAPQPFAEGFGLNMLLQDPWMVIHPPIVFLGYAAFAIPYAIGMASLWRREYKGWISQALPWVSFAFVSLGAGIIIGGVWSYKVLGWGGYWGWDPVENASLLPWLMGTGLLHSMLLQKSTGRLAKTNYLLASLSFILILYSTFLTRSGVLADFSVHSFVDLGITGWLVFFIMAFIAITAYFLISRSKEIPVPKAVKQTESSFFSLEFGLIAAVILLALSAVLTGLGTSAPLITRLMEQASKVSTSFYVKVNLPIAILIGLFLSYVPLLKYGNNEPSKLIPRLIVGMIVAVISAVVTIMNGFPGILVFLMVVFAGFTAGVNFEVMIRMLRKSFPASAAAITHLGVGLMFIGFVASSGYDKAQRVTLPKGETKEVLGYKVTFIDAKMVKEGKGTRLYLPVQLEKDGNVMTGQPDIYVESLRGKENNRFQHPYIERGWWSDVYVSPEGFESGTTAHAHQETKHLTIVRGETEQLKDYEITFVKYDISRMGNAEGTISVGAELLVSYKDAEPVTLTPYFSVGGQQHPQSQVKLPGQEGAFLTIVGMDATKKTVDLHYMGSESEAADEKDTEKQPVLYAEVSTKPGMSILWLGVTLVMLGGMVSIYRRSSRNN
ncbi:hypothetical protein GF337_03065 [candidate division KSB1 bacterium]|nr:hypothetical protein [candidate division KSB1 bacterium]